MEEIFQLKEKVAKKTPISEKTLTLQLEHTQRETELVKYQLTHVKAEVQELQGSRKELRSVLRRLANGEAKSLAFKNWSQRKSQQNALSHTMSSLTWPPVGLRRVEMTTAAAVVPESSPIHPQGGKLSIKNPQGSLLKSTGRAILLVNSVKYEDVISFGQTLHLSEFFWGVCVGFFLGGV